MGWKRYTFAQSKASTKADQPLKQSKINHLKKENSYKQHNRAL